MLVSFLLSVPLPLVKGTDRTHSLALARSWFMDAAQWPPTAPSQIPGNLSSHLGDFDKPSNLWFEKTFSRICLILLSKHTMAACHCPL